MRDRPVQTSELLNWIEEDWVGLWELADAGGIDEGVPLEVVAGFVVDSVEPGLRAGVIRLGRVFHTESGKFEPIDVPVHDAIALIRQGVRRDVPDIEIDLWFDSVPPGDRLRRPGIS